VCQYRSILFIHHMVMWVVPLKGSLYILIHTEIKLGAMFSGLTVVVESIFFQ
jgi:hypothetical protein